jgi:hypothetical protein
MSNHYYFEDKLGSREISLVQFRDLLKKYKPSMVSSLHCSCVDAYSFVYRSKRSKYSFEISAFYPNR